MLLIMISMSLDAKAKPTALLPKSVIDVVGSIVDIKNTIF
jgi:hypothetical protein